MNKKYMVDLEGKVTVVTDEGEIIERDNYTKYTDEILSLENVVESLETKINIFKDRLKQHQSNKQNRKMEMIIIPITVLALTVAVLLLSQSLEVAGLMGLIGIPVCLLYETISVISYFKSNNKEKVCAQRIKEELHRVEKIKKRINMFSKNKAIEVPTETNKFIDVKSIYDFNFDPSDYFIEKYQIDKTTKQMSKGHVKTRKLTKQDNSAYKY